MKQKKLHYYKYYYYLYKVCNNIISKMDKYKNKKLMKTHNIITNLYNYSSTSRFSTCWSICCLFASTISSTADLSTMSLVLFSSST